MTYTVFMLHERQLIYVKRFEDEDEAMNHATELVLHAVRGVVVAITPEEEIRLPPPRTPSFLV